MNPPRVKDYVNHLAGTFSACLLLGHIY